MAQQDTALAETVGEPKVTWTGYLSFFLTIFFSLGYFPAAKVGGGYLILPY